MPIYEYACTACGERLEAKQSFDDPPLQDCPKCGGKLRKLYSPVGIVFKGSGFYSTDAKKKDTAAQKKTSDKTDKAAQKKPSEPKKDAPKSGTSAKKEPA